MFRAFVDSNSYLQHDASEHAKTEAVAEAVSSASARDTSLTLDLKNPEVKAEEAPVTEDAPVEAKVRNSLYIRS
jgi:hypothetical protein